MTRDVARYTFESSIILLLKRMMSGLPTPSVDLSKCLPSPSPVCTPLFSASGKKRPGAFASGLPPRSYPPSAVPAATACRGEAPGVSLPLWVCLSRMGPECLRSAKWRRSCAGCPCGSGRGPEPVPLWPADETPVRLPGVKQGVLCRKIPQKSAL